MEHRLPDRLRRLIEKPEADQEGQESSYLNAHRHENDTHGYLHQAPQLVHPQALPHQEALRQGEALADDNEEEGCQGHEAQAPDEHEGQDEYLAGTAPVLDGVLDDETGHGGRGGSREQGGHNGSEAAAAIADRQ